MDLGTFFPLNGKHQLQSRFSGRYLLRRTGLRPPNDIPALAVIGAGRLGRALVTGLIAAGLEVAGPLGRNAGGDGYEAVLLCVPSLAKQRELEAV